MVRSKVTVMTKTVPFYIGCNYWASNAGMYMWRRFDESVVRADLAFLARYGVKTIRVFPLWPDFQPIEKVLCAASDEIRVGDRPLPAGASGLDEAMLDRFRILLNIAAENDMSVIVSLLTGWMSGRLFVPPALVSEDPLTSPLALRWQKRFVKAFVSRFKDVGAIIAWEPGNECNCMGNSPDADTSAAWLSAVTDAIRSVDDSRPVYAGMHSLSCRGVWRIDDVAEHTDMLTTHPYPFFTPHCAREKLNTMRAALHAAAESVFYAGIGGKPCMVEEIGTLGPMVAGEGYAADYLETALLSSRAYGAAGFLWWCAFDQNMLDFPPYDCIAVEQDLGLAYSVGHPKKALEKLGELSGRLPAALPAPDTDAVVLLYDGHDAWTVAYGAFVLGVQSGVTVDFVYRNRPLRDSAYYILPSVAGTAGIPRYVQQTVTQKVADGARLLITYDGGYIGNFEKLTGLSVVGREERATEKTFVAGGSRTVISCTSELVLTGTDAEVLLRDDAGNILLSRNRYGRGWVYFFNAPLERYFSGIAYPCDTGLYRIYKTFFGEKNFVAEVESGYCGVTVHSIDASRKIIAVISYGGERSVPFRLSPEYFVESIGVGRLDGNCLHFEEKWAMLNIVRR